MRICCISDTHGKLPDLSGYEYDLVVHAGDVCAHHPHPRVYAKSIEDWEFQQEWMKKKFVPWVDKLKSPIVMIAGNHDYVFQQYGFLDTIESVNALHPKIRYLKDSCCEVNGIKFFGSPWSKFFFDWAFNLPEDPERSDEVEKALYSLIPNDVDIVLTHGPMYNVLDLVEETIVYNTPEGEKVYEKKTYTGSRILKDKLFQLDKIKLHCTGHIHSGYGQVSGLGKAGFTSINAAILDERYKLVKPPIFFDIA